MATTHIDTALWERRSNASRAVCEELHALALRRAEHHARTTEEQPR